MDVDRLGAVPPSALPEVPAIDGVDVEVVVTAAAHEAKSSVAAIGSRCRTLISVRPRC